MQVKSSEFSIFVAFAGATELLTLYKQARARTMDQVQRISYDGNEPDQIPLLEICQF